MDKAKVSKSEECKWWQKHVWTKWTLHKSYKITFVSGYHIKHVFKRTCKRCGTFEFRKIIEY